MNCHRFASLLDEHGFDLLGKPDHDELRRSLETHTEDCADCRAALVAVRALHADTVPVLGPVPLPGGASDSARSASAAHASAGNVGRWSGSATMRRAVTAIGMLLLGGAVFAAIGVYVVADRGDVALTDTEAAESGDVLGLSPVAPAADGGDASPTTFAEAATPLVEYLEAAERQAHERLSAEILETMPDGEFFALLRMPPAYPPEAARQGKEGDVIVEFTLTAAGDVTDAFVVESSDPVFESSALDSVLKSKYRPRVVNGEPQSVAGVRNLIRYKLEPTANDAAADRPADGDEPAGSSESDAATEDRPIDLGFGGRLTHIAECVESNDLRCAELELDYIFATMDLTPGEASYLHHIYGFIHHRRGRYELAIESYRKAVGTSDDGAFLRPQQLQTLALIYYERDRYQEALDTMLEFERVAPRMTAANYLFMDRLRELGAQDR